MRGLAKTAAICVVTGWAVCASAGGEYLLSPGDVIRITVFENPDLTTEARVSESGQVSFPLVGATQVGGMSVAAAEKRIAGGLKKGGYVLEPQVIIFPLEIRGNQVSVLGRVNRAGRFPLETSNMRVADLLALAGGVAPDGADVVVLTGMRDGQPMRQEIPLAQLFSRDPAANVELAGGDILFVDRAPIFYVYGEVQKPGAYRIEPGMTLIQALATGGGLTNRGTERGMQVHRRDASGKVDVLSIDRNAPLRADDVIYVKQSLF
ncbi:polysaccharide export protein EpsE [Aromatoleum anaerobium]|uniref:Polysaccharide export protein EpsE n=1 Tax=Aromatoleum anaerobium TaxID=182180 RepID=A0ABX1PGY0_9RHOO|nr:polysaccharide export protein EpsE [Aromatoleum anaerobium]MCK0507735.1 polysaccharide export protein EpsE [Aromatoleum anaerobium]